MKKIIILAATLFASAAMMAQTYVSTEPSNKNVILEEYTGVNCGYCPQGHAIANQICASNPGRVFAINIHTGGYAPTYTTQWGDALADQTNLTGYPSGTVNRHAFIPDTTALNRGSWATASNQIMAQASPVNVASHATIDLATRLLTVDVEIYYTADEASATNMLNVAILQNNIVGQQSGASGNPDQVLENGLYNHMHMLRHLLTGQWGETIEQTTAGTFVHKTYTYTLPAAINNYESNTSVAIPVLPEDIDVVVFVAQGHQEILSGCEAEMSYLNGQPKIASLTNVTTPGCEISFQAKATIKNLADDPLTSATLHYTVGQFSADYQWSGNLASGESEEILLPEASDNFQSAQNYDYTVAITSVNGEAISDGDEIVTIISVSKSVYSADGPFTFVVATDQYASETSFEITNASGTAIVHGGPWPNNPTVRPRIYTFDPAAGCYTITVYDAYGDGINSSYGAGYISLSNADGEIFHHNGKFASEVSFFLNVTSDGTGSVDILSADNANLNLYPNPASDQLNISCSEEILSLDVYDLSGRNVMSLKGDVKSINTSNLSNGIYTLRVKTAKGVGVDRFVKE